MGIVNIQHGMISLGNALKLDQRRQRPTHRIDAVNRDDGVTKRAVTWPRSFQTIRVVVLKCGRLNSLGLGDFGPLVDAMMGILIDHQSIMPGQKRG